MKNVIVEKQVSKQEIFVKLYLNKILMFNRS